ncbi:MAG: hypothetical protein KGP13_10825 [Burkholderiales bacterium]|nr:hypothetical protein [Burkholderiales bacterium]
MKIQLLSGLIACITCGLVQADWLEYADNGKAVFYYDPTTLQINKDKVIVWEMLNYSFPLNRVLSSKTRKEYDCGKQLFRNLSGEFFSGPLLSGDRISASEEADLEWRVAVEGTRNLELLLMLCPKNS